MKKYIPVLLFVITLSYSCVSSDMANYTPVTPEISALNNGQSWTATLKDTVATDSVQLNASNKLNLLRIKVPLATVASFTLTGGNNRYFIRNSSGDITKTFKLDNNYANIVKTTLNTSAGSISGGFNMRFILDPQVTNNDTTGTDTVTFTNGYFIAPSK